MRHWITLTFALLGLACTQQQSDRYARAARFWDRTDLEQARLPEQAPRLEEQFAEYVDLLESFPTPEQAGPLLSALLDRTERAGARTFRFFSELCEKYFYSPESPVRDDELYLHALERIVASGHLNDYEKLRPRYQLNMARRNRPGEPATDFTYTLPDGSRGTLHGIDAPYTVIVFGNPGCAECTEAIRQLRHRPFLRLMQAAGHLRVLNLYSDPEEDYARWRDYAKSYPASWINACDQGALLHYRGLYDLRSTPCFYLLDSRKRVLCKGTTDVRQLARTLRRAVF